MKRFLTALVLCGLAAFLAAPSAFAQEGRNTEDNFEVEGHFGFYWNLRFPTDVDENSNFTSFLNTNVASANQAFFRPQIRSKDFRWHWGLRLSGDVSPRVSLEYSYDMSQDDNFRFNRTYVNTVLPAARAAIPTGVLRRFRDDAGRILVHHVNVVYHTREGGRFVPYVTGGLTVVTYGHGPLIDFLDTASSDFVALEYARQHTKIGGNLGGGFKYYASRHVGVRVDGRFLLTDSEFTQRGFSEVGTAVFGPDVTSSQRGLYSNFHLSFGLFGRF